MILNQNSPVKLVKLARASLILCLSSFSVNDSETQGKNWDSSGAIGPWLVPFTDAAQIDDARIITRVNGEVRQDDVLSRMMFPIRKEIEYISTFMTLKPGDIIVTGTPTGAGARLDPPQYLKPGDLVEIEVEGIGVLSNGIEDEVVQKN